MISTPDPPEPEYEPLVVGNPTVTGQAIVGYTLSCSDPSIEGGSGDVTVNYYWQDANSKGRQLYMGQVNSRLVKAADIGRTICCQVYVADNQTGENFTVISNSVGPVNRPVLPEFDVWVNGELHERLTADVGVEPNGTVVIEVRQMPVSNAPADLTYEWKIRNGTGRLSGETLTCSQREITGGSGDLTINYYWQDINSRVRTWAQRMSGQLDVGRK